jgi:hypothetical protein
MTREERNRLGIIITCAGVTREEYFALHQALMELWDDFARHNPRAMIQDTTVGQLLTWTRCQLNESAAARRCPNCGNPYGPDTHRCPEVKPCEFPKSS